ncbi:MAG: flagellar biosynthetic protein FliR [Lachnospiraceae bacterium]|nr:flagellar biosynthetic protein FliR [Lachnospiraceae bacterium]
MISYSFSLNELEYFLLVMTRVTCFIFIAPFFNTANTPNRVKIGLGVFVSILIFNGINPHEQLQYDSVLGYAILVMKEALTGLLVGFSANMCVSVTSFAGHIIDMDIGLSMVSLYDPTTRDNATITGVFYQYVLMLILICSGMYRYLIQALIDTFTLIPLTGAIFQLDHLFQTVIQFMSDYIIIGFRIALPVFVVMILLNAILGIMAKVAPQMNMFAVGLQLKILVGLAVVYLTAGMLPGACDFVFEQMKKLLTAFVQGMMP